MGTERNIRDTKETHSGLPGQWRQSQLDFLYRISADEDKAARLEDYLATEVHRNLMETSRNYQWWEGTGKRLKWIVLYAVPLGTIVGMIVKFFRDQPHGHP